MNLNIQPGYHIVGIYIEKGVESEVFVDKNYRKAVEIAENVLDNPTASMHVCDKFERTATGFYVEKKQMKRKVNKYPHRVMITDGREFKVRNLLKDRSRMVWSK